MTLRLQNGNGGIFGPGRIIVGLFAVILGIVGFIARDIYRRVAELESEQPRQDMTVERKIEAEQQQILKLSSEVEEDNKLYLDCRSELDKLLSSEGRWKPLR